MVLKLANDIDLHRSVTASVAATDSRQTNFSLAIVCRKILIGGLLALGVVSGALGPNGSAQVNLSSTSTSATVHGRVLNSAGDLVAGATVHLKQDGASRAEAVVDAKGEFKFSGLAAGTYVLIAEKAGVRSRVATLTISSLQDQPPWISNSKAPRLPASIRTWDRKLQRRPWNSQTIPTSPLPESRIGRPPAAMDQTPACVRARRSHERPSCSSQVLSARVRQPHPQRELSQKPRKKSSAQLSAARPETLKPTISWVSSICVRAGIPSQQRC